MRKSKPTPRVWLSSDMLYDESLRALSPEDYRDLFEAAVGGARNAFARYVHIGPRPPTASRKRNAARNGNAPAKRNG
jgi:hypothetical protein